MSLNQEKLSFAALEARRAYKRRWARENRERVREYNARYWERRAAREAVQQEENVNGKEDGDGRNDDEGCSAK